MLQMSKKYPGMKIIFCKSLPSVQSGIKKVRKFFITLNMKLLNERLNSSHEGIVFGKAFHALSRIADDLYIEALPSGLIFHTVNTSKSAYACFTFKPEFFITYRDDLMEKRKVLIKACLMAFRSLPNLEKSVEKCLFDLTSMTDFLLLKFFCKHGMVKVYQLHFIENETVQGSFPKTGFLCKLTASSRLLHDGIQNFSNSVEELTLTVSSNKVYLRNYVDDEPDPNKVVHTELTLESEEFESFEVEKEMKITFCLKELKAILNFCEGFNVPITIKCQAGGKPVTFSISALKGVDVHFVLATLADRDTQSVSSSMSLLRTSVAQCSKDRDKQLVLDNKEENGISANHSSDTKSHGNINASVQRLPKFPKQITFSSSDDDDDDDDDDTDIEIVINPVPMPMPMPTDQSDQDEVPSTPPHKKFRSLFLGLSQATCASMAVDPDEVLVPDSDDEK